MFHFRHIHTRRQVAHAMKRLYNRGLTTPSGGNISIRRGNLVFITASQIDKATIGLCNVAIVDLKGKNLTPRLKPSMETFMHLSIYQTRPDIKAIVHAHPPLSSAFSAQQNLLSTDINSEAILILGNIGFTSYQPMGSDKLANHVAHEAQFHNVIFLQHHGVVALGTSLGEALDRIEVLESVAQITFVRKLFEITETIPAEEVERIKQLGSNKQ